MGIAFLQYSPGSSLRQAADSRVGRVFPVAKHPLKIASIREGRIQAVNHASLRFKIRGKREELKTLEIAYAGHTYSGPKLH